MSLLRLLTSGKSLVGLKKLDHRYHLPGDKALPTFGSKKNPFRATVFPEKSESSDSAGAQPPQIPVSEEARLVAFNPGDRPGEQARAQATERACVTQVKQEQSEPSKLDVRLEPRRPSGFKALFLWGRAKQSLSVKPDKGRPLVQAELSLDTVKVVRNDLSESDLEVVTVGGQTSKTVERRVEPEPGMIIPEAAYAPAVGRLFSAGKM